MVFDVERARRVSMVKNLSKETIEVEIVRNGLKFKIDERLVQNWIRKLNLEGEEFKMTNITTGAMIWSKTIKGDLVELSRLMGSKGL